MKTFLLMQVFCVLAFAGMAGVGVIMQAVMADTFIGLANFAVCVLFLNAAGYVYHALKGDE